MKIEFDKHAIITLQRDCDGMLVPAGTPLDLPKGTEVSITQALGGSFTVNVYGNLVRIAAKDADALGYDPVDLMSEVPTEGALEEQVWAVLRTCYDPEISVNIVDLGLVYEIQADPEKGHVKITMTLTSAGCGMGPVIEEDAKLRVLTLPGVKNVEIVMVFDPPWDREKMSESARLELGLL